VERLKVITVPAIDWDGSLHTAFTVYNDSSLALRSSAGWTLQDAIEYYVKEYRVEKAAIRLIRPFIPQIKHLRESKKRI
jgi:hypothetical protein